MSDMQECTFEPDLSMTQGRSKSSGSRQSLKKPGPMSKSMPTFEVSLHNLLASFISSRALQRTQAVNTRFNGTASGRSSSTRLRPPCASARC